MKLNVDKSKYILVNFTDNYQFTSRLEVKGETVEIVDKMKILGVTITNKLNWNENTAILIQKVNKRMQLLRAVWGFGSTIPEMVHLWKIYCLSVLEQSCVVWGSSLTQENVDDLERSQKTFAKLVLRDKYINYENALEKLDLKTLSERRKELALSFAHSSIDNNKLNEYIQLRKTSHVMQLRNSEPYKRTKARTKRFKNSSILFMQDFLNKEQ